MAYIQSGLLTPKRSIWRLSIIPETFWAIVFYFKVFWMTLISREESNAYRKPKSSSRSSGFGGGWGGGGAPPGGPGTGGTGTNPRRLSGMSSIRGIDHNATCGSCCG